MISTKKVFRNNNVYTNMRATVACIEERNRCKQSIAKIILSSHYAWCDWTDLLT